MVQTEITENNQVSESSDSEEELNIKDNGLQHNEHLDYDTKKVLELC